VEVNNMASKKTYTIAEAAKQLNISRQAVHEAIKTGKLKAKRGKVVRTVWLVSAAALKSYQVSISHQQRAQK
jgi:excisionase family DNA binding protein